MKKFICVISLLLLGCIPFYGQEKSFKDIYFNAESLLDAGNYKEAVINYQELLKMQPNNANICFKIGYCYVNTILEKDKSIQYLETASKNISDKYNGDSEKEKNAPVDVLYWLGKAYHVNYKFEEAIKILNEYKPKIEIENKDLISEVDKTINYCKNGLELIKNPVTFNITNLGSGINTEFSEHSPVFSADESVLIFTSKREGTTGGKKFENGEFYEDIYISNKKENGTWSTPNTAGVNINTSENEATIGLSIDGQTLFIYKDDNGDGNIYYSVLNGEEWSIPEKFGPTINTKSRETHASISADGNYIYFTSERKGGYGGLDIYVVKRLPGGGWGDAQNLGTKINSPFNEEGPFIHPDGVTLFFSSEGHNSIGGYDIFYSVIDNETRLCTEAKNIGYPINTAENDVFYVPTPDGKRAYYASYQANGVGSSDLYLITLSESEEKQLTVISGVIEKNDKSIRNVNIVVTNLKDKTVVGNYTPNSKTGKFLFILTPGDYNVLYESDDKLYYSENIKVEEGSAYKQINKAINLAPILIGDINETYIAEFEVGSSKINAQIDEELIKLNELLKKNKQLIVDIKLPDDSKNKKLNASRKKSVIDNLISKGIDEYRIMSGLKVASEQDNIVAINISEKTAILASNDTKTTIKNDEKSNNDNVVKAVGTGADVEIDNVFFDFNKAQTNEYYNNLNKLAGYLVENQNSIIEIHGYTDLQGDEEYNMQLSIRRASFVRDYLIEKGAKVESMKIKGFGESNQIAIDLSPESRKFNRRVEFKVTQQGNKTLSVKQINIPDNFKIK